MQEEIHFENPKKSLTGAAGGNSTVFSDFGCYVKIFAWRCFNSNSFYGMLLVSSKVQTCNSSIP